MSTGTKTVLLAGVATLSLLGATSARADGWDDLGESLKPLWTFLRLLETTWLGPAVYERHPWNGVWPKHTTVLQFERGGVFDEHVNWLTSAMQYENSREHPWNGVWPKSKVTVTLQYESGGNLQQHVERWRDLAASGAEVEVRGPCFSGCTLVVVYVPRERLCFGEHASLHFHLATNRGDGTTTVNRDVSLWMINNYPPDIRDWIMLRGGLAAMKFEPWKLGALELWRMGYRRCEPRPAPRQ
jgi:hypothetical protein